MAADERRRANQRVTQAAAALTQVTKWLNHDAFADCREELATAVCAGQWSELIDAFSAELRFGTAGRRGRMGPGPGRINARTIAESAAGLADCVLAAGAAAPSVVIAYDTRHNSRTYARLCAAVMAKRGFTVYLYDAPRATPMLAFAVHRLKAACGIMITASHNPPADNGFKAYWSHGGQVVPPYDSQIIACAEALPEEPIARAKKLPTPDKADWQARIDKKYIDYVAAQGAARGKKPKSPPVLVYTMLQGTGDQCVVPVLARRGYPVIAVPGQDRPSGDFEAVTGHKANPEEERALDQLRATCAEHDAEAGLASDPDADRVGFVARDPGDPTGYRYFTGQQIGVLVTAHVCGRLAGEAAPESRPLAGRVVLKSAVTSELVTAIGEAYGADVVGDLPVGFRWMGELIEVKGLSEAVLVAIEESHGVNCGGEVRDKDAASASLALAELVDECCQRGITVGQYLDEVYLRFGYYNEAMVPRDTADNAERDRMMARLRQDPPERVAGLPVTAIEDRQQGSYLNPCTGEPVIEDFLIFTLGGDDTVDRLTMAVRPSGTEPKVKVYAAGCRAVADQADLDQRRPAVDGLVTRAAEELLAYALS